MEHGSYADNSNATFSLTDEDHTLANAVRFSLNQESVLAFLFLSQYFIFICMFQFFLNTSALVTFILSITSPGMCKDDC